MSQDFHKVLIQDDRLLCTDDLSYAVYKGGQNMTPAQFGATSSSNSSHVFNIQVPSEQTIIDRRVMWSSSVSVVVTGIPSNGEYLVNYGILDAFSPWPLHQSCTTMNATINNNTVTMNVRDVLPALLHLVDKDDIAVYNSCTPTWLDFFGSYPANNGYSASLGLLPNLSPLLYPNGNMSMTSDKDNMPRGSWVVNSIAGNTIGDGVASRSVTITATFEEPLMISPFIWSNPSTNNQGIYGVQNLNFQFQIGDPSRVFRLGTYAGLLVNPNASLNTTQTKSTVAWATTAFTGSTLKMNFLTCHPSTMLSSRNIVPYQEFPRYISAINLSTPLVANAPLPVAIATNTIQLNCIPDKLILFVRKPLSQQDNYDADCFLTINSVSISFNNQAGILASATPQDLWRMSVEAGSGQTWHEFRGLTTLSPVGQRLIVPAGGFTAGSQYYTYPTSVVYGNTTNSSNATSNTWGAGTTEASGWLGRKVGTCGSVLALNFGQHIALQDDYLSAGSIGNYNMQINLNVTYNNQLGDDQIANPSLSSLEVVLCTMNSGVFVTEKGTSSTFVAVLSKQDVLDASAMTPISNSSAERIVGGGLLDKIKSAVGYLAPIAKKGLSMVNHPYAQTASKVLDVAGYGKSGGGRSGGLKKHLM